MRLGFNMLLWTTHVTEANVPVLGRLKAAGYDGVEIPLFEGNEAHYRGLGRILRDEGLGATTVTVIPSGRSCIAADAATRAKGLDHLKWAIACSRELGADVCAGPFHQPLGEFSGKGPTVEEVQHCVDVHRKAAEIAAAAGVKLSVEPLNRFECYFLNSADQAAALVREVGQPNYGYLYDTFHFNIEENDPVAAVARTARAINHVHISENHRGTPGDGHIAFGAVIAALCAAGYDGWLTVEAFGSALPDLAAATKIWRPLFDRPEDVYLGAIDTMRAGLAAAGRG
jgi:D-psicose/D-tagatose/L-ribulose 3-epimerase